MERRTGRRARPGLAQRSQVVDGLAAYGRFTSLMSAVGATFFAIIGIAIGIFMIKKSDAQVESAATASAPSTCSQELVSASSNGNTRTRLENRCTTDVAYTASGSQHRSSVDTSAVRYATGDSLSVYYEPGSVGEVSASRVPRGVGYIIIGGSIFVAVCAWVWCLITSKFQLAAAAGGASSLLGAVSGGLRGTSYPQVF
jgi:hypothetical protein